MVFTDHTHLLLMLGLCFVLQCVLSRFDVSNDLNGEERAGCLTFVMF